MSIPLAMSPVGYDTWVTELKRALYDYLGQTGFEVEYLSTEKKLVINTDKVSEEEYAEVANIAAEYMPAGTTLEQYNYIVPFIRLDYLESTGTQYINTGITASADINVKTTWEWLWQFTRDAQYVYGGIFTDFAALIATPIQGRPHFYANKSILWVNNAIDGIQSFEHTWYDVTHNGVTQTFSDHDELTTWPRLNLFSGAYGYSNALIRIYSFAISRAGVQQLNFIPCLDLTGKPCMYDTVTGTPFYNQGTGDDFDFGAKYTNELQFSKALSMLPASSPARIFKVSVPEEVLASPLIQKLMQKCRTEKNWIIQTIN